MVKTKRRIKKTAIKLHYRVIIAWSDDDDCYVVEVPDLPGCMTHGDTYREAIAMAEDAMSGWLEVAMETGHPIPKPTTFDHASSRK